MLTKEVLIEAFLTKDYQTLYNECSKHGKTTLDWMFDVKTGRFKGAHRRLLITHCGIQWTFELLDGNIRIVRRN